MTQKTLYDVEERETWQKGTEQVVRRQYYSLVHYEDDEFSEAYGSGDDFPYAQSTLRRRGYQYVHTRYYYRDEHDVEHEFDFNTGRLTSNSLDHIL